MASLQTSRFRKVSAGWRLFSLLAILLVTPSAYLLRSSIRASYLFNELKTLQLGHSTFDDAQRLASRIGAYPVPYTPCDRSYCEWEVKIGNSDLPKWWRGAGETFVVSFDVKDSVVARKNTGYGVGIETDTFFQSSVGLIEQENWGRSPRPQPIAAGWQTSELYRYYEFVIYMTPKASAEQRRRYTSFNFSCFWKYQGCKDARELLPTADPFPE